MMIYLDSSALNRIFDDQTQARIYLEASSMLLIFALIEERSVDIVSSSVLFYENSLNPYDDRRVFVHSVLTKAKVFQIVNGKIVKRAQEIESEGIRGLDSLHLACAEASEADFFITCDDKIFKKYNGKIEIINPVEFIITSLKEDKK